MIGDHNDTVCLFPEVFFLTDLVFFVNLTMFTIGQMREIEQYNIAYTNTTLDAAAA